MGKALSGQLSCPCDRSGFNKNSYGWWYMYKLYLNPIADGKYRSLPTVIPEFQHWVSRLYGYEPATDALYPIVIFNDILHMSFLAGTHVFKAFPAYTTTEL